MADFKVVLQKAQEGYTKRDDYPPFAMMPWEDRPKWTAYLAKINAEMDAEMADNISKMEE